MQMADLPKGFVNTERTWWCSTFGIPYTAMPTWLLFSLKDWTGLDVTPITVMEAAAKIRFAYKTLAVWRKCFQELDESDDNKRFVYRHGKVVLQLCPDFWDSRPYSVIIHEYAKGIRPNASWARMTDVVRNFKGRLQHDPRAKQASIENDIFRLVGRDSFHACTAKRLNHLVGNMSERTHDSKEVLMKKLNKLPRHWALVALKSLFKGWVTSTRMHETHIFH